MKKLRLGLVLFYVFLSLTACAEPAPTHVCADPCSVCGLCLNSACNEETCAEKCVGHHECESICDRCGLCLDAECAEETCAEKCVGHHECESICEKCGLCLDAECAEDACVNKCRGHHECESICDRCGLCLDTECAEDTCAKKCDGHWEEPYDFDSGDYVTTSNTSVDTGIFVFDIGKGVYVPESTVSLGKTIAQTVEKVSGLDFNGNGYGRAIYKDGKIHVNVTRDSLYVDMDWYQGLSTNEGGSAFADAINHVVLSPLDLMPYNIQVIIHESSHVLAFKQSEWSYSGVLNEGFAEYTSYLTLKELSKDHSESTYNYSCPEYVIFNVTVHDYKELYKQPIEYWFENEFEYALNGNYAVGFRFMRYLDEVYGDYSKWITEFEKTYCFRELAPTSDQASAEQQIKVLKAVYGDDVLDNFYPWLKQNEDLFTIGSNVYIDLTDAEGINLYPRFDAVGINTKIEFFEYEDLYLNVETVREYLDYKDIDSSGLRLVLSNNATVRLYSSDGSYETKTGVTFPLDGVSYIKLVSKGKLSRLRIDGYEP